MTYIHTTKVVGFTSLFYNDLLTRAFSSVGTIIVGAIIGITLIAMIILSCSICLIVRIALI